MRAARFLGSFQRTNCLIHVQDGYSALEGDTLEVCVARGVICSMEGTSV